MQESVTQAEFAQQVGDCKKQQPGYQNAHVWRAREKVGAV